MTGTCANMASSKNSTTIVYTGEGKGKTSASLGLLVRALGAGKKVAFIQFIKHWQVSEHKFIADISDIYKDQLLFYKGGKGFYNAGDMSAKNVSDDDHIQAARKTYEKACALSTSDEWDLVICDEINNAVADGLLSVSDLENLLLKRHKNTSLCLTGRNFPEQLLGSVDIATDMTKLRHHYDDGHLAQEGIDY